MKKTKSDWKQEFKSQVTWKHIKYDHDGGHAYSIIDHPLMLEISTDFDEDDELLDFSNEWLYDHEDLPPCKIAIGDDGSVGSGCGCHDHLNKEEDQEEIESIIMDLIQYEDDTDLQLI